MHRLAAGLAAALSLAAPAGAQIADPASTEHVDLGPGIEGWLYLKRDDFAVTRMRIAPGAQEMRHLHSKARLFITALSGTMTVEIGGKTHVVETGEGIEVPPGTPHKAGNAGTAPLELMVVALPPSAGDREPVSETLAAEPAAVQVMRPDNAEHYLWGGANDGWHYVKRDDLSVIRERMLPGALEERHLHRKARQFFTVLSGRMTLEIGGTDRVIAAGEGIEVPPGVPHQAKNPTGEPIAFIVVSMPPSHGDREAAPR